MVDRYGKIYEPGKRTKQEGRLRMDGAAGEGMRKAVKRNGRLRLARRDTYPTLAPRWGARVRTTGPR